MVRFATGLTGWVDSSWFSVISVVCFVCVGFVGNLVVGDSLFDHHWFCFCLQCLCCFGLGLSCISIDGAAFNSGLGFCSGEKFVWVSRDLVSWLLAS